MAVNIDELLSDLIARDASDLHVKANNHPIMRVLGSLVRCVEYPIMSEQEVHAFLTGILNPEREQRLMEFRELDLGYHVPGLARFRVNMYWQRGKLGALFRVIPFNIRTIDDLRMPQVCKRIALLPRGLVLVTGPTGCGKSTSLAAMIHHINISQRCHILTIEDPIEYVHEDKTAIINQRELGTDTRSFADALKHVMRQNPDVIFVGEMRDLQTIQLAITAAETGHLVFSTVHTVDAAQTIDRIVDVFPPSQQAQIRTQLSVTLQAVISQCLLPTADGKTRIAAFEVMTATSSIRTLIRDGKTHQLYLDIQTGAELGMQTMDGDLLQLVQGGHITYEEAEAKSSNVSDFQRRAMNLGLVVATHAAH